jgi:hypothetical protein
MSCCPPCPVCGGETEIVGFRTLPIYNCFFCGATFYQPKEKQIKEVSSPAKQNTFQEALESYLTEPTLTQENAKK